MLTDHGIYQILCEQMTKSAGVPITLPPISAIPQVLSDGENVIGSLGDGAKSELLGLGALGTEGLGAGLGALLERRHGNGAVVKGALLASLLAAPMAGGAVYYGTK